MKIKKEKVGDNAFHYHFLCPGCNTEHTVNDTWEFNQDIKNPTFYPSIAVSGCSFNEKGETITVICHSYIKNGQIEFLPECNHSLAGQTAELIEYINP
jgi:hypothetical protein